ncbi:MAG: YiiX/YebB-like N1pC/P60 family cysteine hydrolase [Akkermansiaceae bacterium]
MNSVMTDEVSQLIARAARSVRSAAPALPAREEMDQELADAEAAQQRGYFSPDEDERLCGVFVRYLSARAVLLGAVDAVQPVLADLDNLDQTAGLEDDVVWQLRIRAFVAGFAAAAMLVRSATFIVDLAAARPVVWKKLDEAEPRYGIPAKCFTLLYKRIGSARTMWRFHEAMMFYEVHRDDVLALGDDPVVGDLVRVLQEEEGFLQYRKRDYLKRKWGYRLHSFKRRHVSGYKKVMFHLLKMSGSAVAEMRQPFVKPMGAGKRVTAEVINALLPMLRAGDVFITRHDDALSNLFLPGFWPHAALYIGTDEERKGAGVVWSKSDGRCLKPFHFLEAKKDGVLFRSIHETLQVDAFMVLRPTLELPHIGEVLSRALTHEGKLYDFLFDFRKADRLACTEVVYRSFHGIGSMQFELRKHTGRPCISAEDLIEQALASGNFSKVIDYGVEVDELRQY